MPPRLHFHFVVFYHDLISAELFLCPFCLSLVYRCEVEPGCGKNLKRVRLFKTFRGLILPGVGKELIQDQGIARSFFNGRPDAGICFLVAIEAVAVTVLIRLTEISLIDTAVAET